MIEKDETKQFSITLGMKDYNDLKDWSHAHGKTVAEFASQILANRVEANQSVIEQLRRRSRSDNEHDD